MEPKSMNLAKQDRLIGRKLDRALHSFYVIVEFQQSWFVANFHIRNAAFNLAQEFCDCIGNGIERVRSAADNDVRMRSRPSVGLFAARKRRDIRMLQPDLPIFHFTALLRSVASYRQRPFSATETPK